MVCDSISRRQYSPLEMAVNSSFFLEDGNSGGTYVQGRRVDPPPSRIEDSNGELDDDTTCGWFRCRPSCIQGCNRSVWFLVFWCSFALFQSTTVNGLVYVVTTTLERRFSLTSARSGAISSTFDFTVLALILFLTYLTERLRKPLLIGSGAVVFAIGSYVFTLPHFLSPKYEAGALDEKDICRSNVTGGKCDLETERSLSGLYWYFIAGQVLHGIGASPIYTHGRTYVYENVRAQLVPVYFAILQLASSLGVAVGYLFGGVLLGMYTDISVDHGTLNITPNSPLWIGNWWIGFIIVGTLALMTSLPLTGFPGVIRGTGAIREGNERHLKPQKGSEFYSTAGLKGLVRDFPRAIWNLLRNVPLMCINFGVSTEFFFVASVTVFGPKFFEAQFNLQATSAAMLAGSIVVPSSIVGVLAGGWIVKAFNLKFTGQAKLCMVALLISLMTLVAFLMGCPNVMFAGVTTSYDNRGIGDNDDVVNNISDACNVGCNCLDSFAPVCGSNNVMYYSACHAGCSSLEVINATQQYVDCACIPPINNSTLGGSAVEGRCGIECNRIFIFIVLVIVAVSASSIVFVPSQTMLLGVVSSSQRTTAMGLQSLMFRGLGSVPGPIIFGTIIDSVCLIWEDDCSGARTCWMYQNKQFSFSTFVMLMLCRSLSLLFFTAALFAYKPSEEETDEREEKATDDATDTEL